MKLPETFVFWLKLGGGLSAAFAVPYLIFWFAPSPWDHVACIVLAAFAFSGAVALMLAGEEST